MKDIERAAQEAREAWIGDDRWNEINDHQRDNWRGAVIAASPYLQDDPVDVQKIIAERDEQWSKEITEALPYTGPPLAKEILSRLSPKPTPQQIVESILRDADKDRAVSDIAAKIVAALEAHND